ncbi:hypothetical protein CPB86DRAFT_789606 [Serendipita vermifera]|nr:hypothetical protein CPB86DRAFT_789606 [Serendipita vermifera]
MFKFSVTIFAAALLTARPILAQNLTQFTPCVQNCATTAVAATACGNIENIYCVCSDLTYINPFMDCIMDTCPNEATSGVIAFQSNYCTEVIAEGPNTSTRSATRAMSFTSATSSPTFVSAGDHTTSMTSGVALVVLGAMFSLL